MRWIQSSPADATLKVEVDVTVAPGVVRKSETVMDKLGRPVSVPRMV